MAKIAIEMPEYDEMHAALDAHDFDRYFDMAEAFDKRVREVASEIFDMASAHGCVMVDTYGLEVNDDPYTRRRHRHYLHRSTRYPGCLQLTSWDCDGPIGDVRIPDARTLCGELRHMARGTVWCSYEAA